MGGICRYFFHELLIGSQRDVKSQGYLKQAGTPFRAPGPRCLTRTRRKILLLFGFTCHRATCRWYAVKSFIVSRQRDDRGTVMSRKETGMIIANALPKY